MQLPMNKERKERKEEEEEIPRAHYAGGNDDKWARCASRVDRKFSFGEISMVKGPLCLRSSCMYSDAFEH